MQLKKLAKQTAVYGLPSIIGRFLSFLLVPLYTYTFDTDQYGIVTEFYAYMALLLVLLTHGMETTFFRYMQKYKGKDMVYSTGMWSLIFASSTFFLLILLFKDKIGGLLGYDNAAEYVLMFSLILVAEVISSLPFCLLREQNRAMRFASLKMLNIFLNVGLNLFFIVFCPMIIEANPDSIISYIYSSEIGVWYIFISNLIASSITLICLIPELRKIRFRFSPLLWRKMMGYALPVMIWGLAGIVDGTFDRILIKYLTPNPDIALSQLGIYGACYKLSIIMSLFIQAFRFAAEPFFFKQAETKDAKLMYATVMNYFVITCAFIYLICVLFLDQILYFIGKDYREGAAVVPILLMANLLLGIFYNLSVWYKIKDRTKVGMYISLIGTIVNLSLNLALIPYIGYMGAAWAALCSYMVITAVSYFWGQKCYKIPYNLKKIFFYVFIVWLVGYIKNMVEIESMILSISVSVILVAGFATVVICREVELRKGLGDIIRKNILKK